MKQSGKDIKDSKSEFNHPHYEEEQSDVANTAWADVTQSKLG